MTAATIFCTVAWIVNPRSVSTPGPHRIANHTPTVTARTTHAAETPRGSRRSLEDAAANNSNESGATALATAADRIWMVGDTFAGATAVARRAALTTSTP